MRYLVFETKTFKDDLIHYGLQKSYESQKTKIENGETTLESIEGLEKCNLEGNFRLLGWDVTRRILGEDKDPGILVFLSILKRGGHEYNQFIATTDWKGRLEVKERLQKQLTADQEEVFKNAYEEYMKAKVVKKPDLPPEIYKWLEVSKWSDKLGKDDIGYCESEIWTKEIKNLTGHLSVFRKALEVIAFDILDGHERSPINIDYPNLFVIEEGECAVFYSLRSNQQGTLVFLIKPVILKQLTGSLEEVANQIIAQFAGIFKGFDIHMDDILKHSHQAYPVEMVMEDDLWFRIQKNEESHPALSTEEENILLSISSPGGTSLPIFINGRAGSGKSTLLQYIFCLYARQKLTGTDGEVLYLTYSEQLRKSAAELCLKILKSHYNFVGARVGEKMAEQEIDKLIKKSFRTFQDLLLDMLPMNEGKQFAESKRLTFHHFRTQFYSQVLKTPIKCSAETAWHIIRAYIKGRESGSELLPEEYQAIPGKDQTIDFETYKLVFERVWPQYKSYLKEKEYWDDLDLVNRVLWLMDNDSTMTDKKYVAIFCDEAQDFTKTELALILRMSVFSEYDLSKNKGINSLPFAFAGDPLQTLTPTGFNWDRFTAMFYDALKESLLIEDPQPFIHNKLMDLEYNYRSNEGIVKFSNLVQFLRFSILGETCKPQKCWREDKMYEYFDTDKPNSVPKYFIFQKNLSEKEFELNARESVIILPSEEGGLEEFISNDGILRQMKENQQGEIAFEDAISSKGLEMNKVIIYKFGQHLKDADELWGGGELSQDKLVYFKYYLNRLYVAVTRAKKQLNIVDTAEGYNQFWRRIKGDNLANLDHFAEWNEQDCFVYLLEGSEPADLVEDKPLNNARMYKEAGIQERNPNHLAKASSIFRLHNQQEDAAECNAYRRWYLGEYKAAGQEFLKLQAQSQKSKAQDCFWEGQEWEDLDQWYAIYGGVDSDSQRKRNLARFKIALKNKDKDIILDTGLMMLREEFGPEENRLMVERYSDSRAEFIHWVKDNVELLNKYESEGILDYLEVNIDTAPVDLSISLAYKLENYNKVVELAEDNDWFNDQYWESKLMIEESDNEKIKCLLQLKHINEAIEVFEAMDEISTTKDVRTRMLVVYEQLDHLDKVAPIYLSLGEYLEAFKFIKKHIKKFEPDYLENILTQIYREIINSKSVERLLRDILLLKDKEVGKTILPALFAVIASESIDAADLDIPHRLVNDFFKNIHTLAIDDFNTEQIIAASLAFERIDCKRIDMMNYYEALMRRSDIEPKTLKFVRERWLYVKNKHTSSEKATNKKDAREEIERKKELWGIEKIPTTIHSLEDTMSRIGYKKERKSPKKEKLPLIPIEIDKNRFSFEDFMIGEIEDRGDEYRIRIHLPKKPNRVLFRIDDKQFKLLVAQKDE